ncbi:MAG: hypothetical protein L0220_22085 [Acidobacteria bacterium]|nr:hypothetical protein [Acidobacteriota bacterium]
MSLTNNNDVILISEWDSESFHRRVLELEAVGYLARKESYNITPEMNPETGIIIHLHTIEMFKPESDRVSANTEGVSG